MDSTAQTGHAGAIDAQEEAYQKIKSMKELYFTDLSEFHQKIALKLQQLEQTLPPGNQSEPFKKLEGFKQMLERMLQFLQIPKSSIPPNMKDKLAGYERQMQGMIASQRPKKIPPVQQQQQFQHANVGNSQPIPPQQQSSQVAQMQLPDNHQNSVQQINLPGTSLQSGGASSLQHMSMPLPTTQQNLSNTIQPSSNMDSVQSDYLRIISLKLLSMETKAQPSPPLNQPISNSGVVNQNPADPDYGEQVQDGIRDLKI